MDVFTQKMKVVFDHLMDNEAPQALNEINQLLNKEKKALKDGKNAKSRLTDKQNAYITLVKASCVARLNGYGEAEQLLDQFLKLCPEWDKEAQQYSRMLISLAIYLRKKIL
jgi:23S rRNA maturation mini-RNase III